MPQKHNILPEPEALFRHRREADIQAAIIKILLLKRFLVIRFNSGAVKADDRYIEFYRIENTKKAAGLPDVIAFKGDRFLMIEVKRPGGKLRESQREFIELATSKKINVMVCDDWETVLKAVEGL